jgi:hypothetical protein
MRSQFALLARHLRYHKSSAMSLRGRAGPPFRSFKPGMRAVLTSACGKWRSAVSPAGRCAIRLLIRTICRIGCAGRFPWRGCGGSATGPLKAFCWVRLAGTTIRAREFFDVRGFSHRTRGGRFCRTCFYPLPKRRVFLLGPLRARHCSQRLARQRASSSPAPPARSSAVWWAPYGDIRFGGRQTVRKLVG